MRGEAYVIVEDVPCNRRACRRDELGTVLALKESRKLALGASQRIIGHDHVPGSLYRASLGVGAWGLGADLLGVDGGGHTAAAVLGARGRLALESHGQKIPYVTHAAEILK